MYNAGTTELYLRGYSYNLLDLLLDVLLDLLVTLLRVKHFQRLWHQRTSIDHKDAERDPLPHASLLIEVFSNLPYRRERTASFIPRQRNSRKTEARSTSSGGVALHPTATTTRTRLLRIIPLVNDGLSNKVALNQLRRRNEIC